MWRAKGRHDWSLALALGEIVANSAPNMSGKRRSVIKLAHLNPFLDGKRAKRGIPLRGKLAEKVLDSCSTEAT